MSLSRYQSNTRNATFNSNRIPKMIQQKQLPVKINNIKNTNNDNTLIINNILNNSNNYDINTTILPSIFSDQSTTIHNTNTINKSTTSLLNNNNILKYRNRSQKNLSSNHHQSQSSLQSNEQSQQQQLSPLQQQQLNQLQQQNQQQIQQTQQSMQKEKRQRKSNSMHNIFREEMNSILDIQQQNSPSNSNQSIQIVKKKYNKNNSISKNTSSINIANNISYASTLNISQNHSKNSVQDFSMFFNDIQSNNNLLKNNSILQINQSILDKQSNSYHNMINHTNINKNKKINNKINNNERYNNNHGLRNSSNDISNISHNNINISCISSNKMNTSSLNSSRFQNKKYYQQQQQYKEDILQNLETDIQKILEQYNAMSSIKDNNQHLISQKSSTSSSKQFNVHLDNNHFEKDNHINDNHNHNHDYDENNLNIILDEHENENELDDDNNHHSGQDKVQQSSQSQQFYDPIRNNNRRESNDSNISLNRNTQSRNNKRQQIQLKEMNSLNGLYRDLITEIMCDTKKQNLYRILNSIIEISERYGNNPEFTIQNYTIFADICKDIGDFNKSIQLMHHARLISSMAARYDLKLSLYKKVSSILSEAGQYNQSLTYLKKMLRLAWKLRDDDREIEAYDLIGKNLMQIGEVDLSEFFHNKSMSNDKEPVDSPLRIAGEIGVKVKLGILSQQCDEHDYKSDTEDDLDLHSFPKSKQDEAILLQQEQQQNNTIISKKSSYFALPKIITNNQKRFQSLGRLNVPGYIRDDLEIKLSHRMSHLSQNRDLKNFYVYTYKNQNFWIKDGDFNQQQKYYILKKNYSKYKQTIHKSMKSLSILLYKLIQDFSNHFDQLESSHNNNINNNNSNKILHSDILLS